MYLKEEGRANTLPIYWEAQASYELGISEAIPVALYLRGIRRPFWLPPSRWPAIESSLRREPNACPIKVLHKMGFRDEASVLDLTLSEAETRVESGGILTALSPNYPRRWFSSLGRNAPPALYFEGELPYLRLPSVAVVGSRSLPRFHAMFAAQVAAAVGMLERSHSLVSGAAPGADTLAEQTHSGPVVEIVPTGLNAWPVRALRGGPLVRLSLWPPGTGFSSAGAMERNALIYAFAGVSVVAHARFKEGGSWCGAVDALRRKLSRVLVPGDGLLAHRALVALGAEAVPVRRVGSAEASALIEREAVEIADILTAVQRPAQPLQPALLGPNSLALPS